MKRFTKWFRRTFAYHVQVMWLDDYTLHHHWVWSRKAALDWMAMYPTGTYVTVWSPVRVQPIAVRVAE